MYRKNGKILQKEKSIIKKEKADRSLLDIKDIYDFITTVDLIDIQEILERQLDYNYAIACAGLMIIMELILEKFF